MGLISFFFSIFASRNAEILEWVKGHLQHINQYEKNDEDFSGDNCCHVGVQCRG